MGFGKIMILLRKCSKSLFDTKFSKKLNEYCELGIIIYQYFTVETLTVFDGHEGQQGGDFCPLYQF